MGLASQSAAPRPRVLRDLPDVYEGHQLLPDIAYAFRDRVWLAEECLCAHCGSSGPPTLQCLDESQYHCLIHGDLQRLPAKLHRHFVFEFGPESASVDTEDDGFAYVRADLNGDELCAYLRTLLSGELEQTRQGIADGDFDS